MNWNKYRPLFLAAALYNLIWGAINIAQPELLFEIIGIPAPTETVYWQVLGMMVLVYAPAYWWAAKDPFAYRHLILIGFLGKLLGPIGFAWALLNGQLPLTFGWVILTNDLIWWPAFASFLRQVARNNGGWTNLLGGR